MQFTFINMAGAVLFLRDDAERAEWTQEEMTLNAEFPYVPGKVISTGQRVYFCDPSTGEQQIYEIKQAKTIEPDALQQVTAENICISELTDEHIDSSTHENTSLSSVLSGVLSGTLWSVGNVDVNPTSSVEISRGSVWQAVLEIRNNYNVYIVPRIGYSSSGGISRYIDVKSTNGTWNGVRLSIDKNMIDPAVIIDDTEVATALYGYGGTEIATSSGEENKEINFADVVWTANGSHPAKPAGQKYLEDPTATANYGRNGRARFAYYQNTDILDPDVLLQKTWETLQTCSTPSVSIEGTIADLYRMGYADQPIKLHDIALVEVAPAGFKKQIQIIKMTTDLLDPSQTVVTIGSYIPNIVYLEKKTNEDVTGSPCSGGSGGGRGGGGGNKSKQTQRQEFETSITANNKMIQLKAWQNDLDDLDNEVKLQEAAITVEHNRITQEVVDRRDADSTLSSRITQTASAITLEVNERSNQYQQLSGRITVNSNKVSLVVTERGGGYVVNTSSIVAGINSDHGSYIRLQADTINLDGYVTVSELNATNARISNLTSGAAQAGYLKAATLSGGSIIFGGHTLRRGYITVDGTRFNVVMWD